MVITASYVWTIVVLSPDSKVSCLNTFVFVLIARAIIYSYSINITVTWLLNKAINYE